ncbi:alpha/beta hydrolase [Solidesulfovibrio sp.]|uniref:alpha/beta fold hydrolase n=1 Tax=Solidesulfovibrio sp. TaxID=2910990 RepID=UPI000EC406C3|nr:alpha/beta hydrolase [Solidesulfovibrio sp.]MEA5089105.1 alpha/beta hydrolase [Solidesulfovibrio sp.]HCR13718.1 alpha/beta hydrolase [Desulfovibrio sp.]HML60788.1 alpha/beta hydrolase [Solidesulfovibrio sp.]
MNLSLPTPRIVNTRLGPVACAVTGEGPAVLSLHGAMGGCDQSAILARLVGPVPRRYVCVSRPGYPGTPLAGRETPEAQADLCAALLDALGIADTAVMAISGGGPCALSFALRHGGRCKALALYSTCAGVIDTPLPLAYRLMSVAARFPWLFGWLRGPSADVQKAARKSVGDPELRRRMQADPETWALFAALVAGTGERTAQRLPGTHNDVAVTRSRDYPLEDIAAPTLVVHGTNDPHVPFARHGAVLAARIPGAQSLAVEGGEHACVFSHRELIRGRTTQFLAAHS